MLGRYSGLKISNSEDFTALLTGASYRLAKINHTWIVEIVTTHNTIDRGNAFAFSK
jgi:hypothetical protein